MVFTPDALWVVTTVKKGMCPHIGLIALELKCYSPTAKHLEGLKGGKTPLEILVRGKDPEQNAKHFERCLDLIKTSGVCPVLLVYRRQKLTGETEEGWGLGKGHAIRPLH